MKSTTKCNIMLALWVLSAFICVISDFNPTAPIFGFTLTYLAKLVIVELRSK